MAKVCLGPFRVVLIGSFIVVFLATILLATSVAPPGGECEEQFMQDLFSCFHEFHVPFNTYLWAVGNGTGGTAPNNETEFRQQMCSVETDVLACVLDSVHALVDTSFCQSAPGMRSLLTVQVRAIFEEYDNYCAHDCRGTLESDMKQCYTDLNLNPQLFLSTNSDGAILGDTESDVSDFCKNSSKLVTCLREKKDACPESPSVMRRLGLDLGSLSNGFKLLCQQQQVYLSSLKCFGKQTRAVEKCQEDNALILMRLISKSKTKEALSPESLLNEFCLARLELIKCDLTSWSIKPEDACDQPALTLKRDLHCNQIPSECKPSLSGLIRDVCTYNWAAVSVKTGDEDGYYDSSGVLAGPERYLMSLVCLLWVVMAFLVF